MTAPPFELSALTRETCDRLASLRVSRPLVVSCYVALGPEDRENLRYQSAAGEALHRLKRDIEAAGLAHDDREALARDLRRIGDSLIDPERVPHAPAVALFACEALELFEAVPLPRAIETRALLDCRPRVAELLDAVQDAGLVIVAAVDRAHVRFFTVSTSEVHELSGLATTATRGGKYHSDRGDAPGWGEAHFHRRIEEERRRHAAETADALVLHISRTGAEGILLAGPVRTTRAVEAALPDQFRTRVIGSVRLNPTAVTVAELHGAVKTAREAAQASRETRLIAELQASLDAGAAVTGVRPALKALAAGQARTLFLPAGQRRTAFRCGQRGRLVAAPGDCLANGPPLPVDLADDLIEEALRQQVGVVLIRDPELGRQLNDLAALLRYR